MPFKQVTIVGTGLIGGSLGLALRKRHLARRIVGCDRAPVLEVAESRGVIEAGSTNLADAVHGSDLVILATPVLSILDLIERLGPSLPARTLVTDVGSTKAEVVAQAAKSFGHSAGQRFLAGHPMAGKEFAGVESSMPTCSKAQPGCSPRCLAKTRMRAGAESSFNARKEWARASPCSIQPIMTASAPGSAICRR